MVPKVPRTLWIAALALAYASQVCAESRSFQFAPVTPNRSGVISNNLLWDRFAATSKTAKFLSEFAYMRSDYYALVAAKGGPKLAPGVSARFTPGVFPFKPPANQKKLGLNLKATKGPVEFIVIEYIETPADN